MKKNIEKIADLLQDYMNSEKPNFKEMRKCFKEMRQKMEEMTKELEESDKVKDESSIFIRSISEIPVRPVIRLCYEDEFLSDDYVDFLTIRATCQFSDNGFMTVYRKCWGDDSRYSYLITKYELRKEGCGEYDELWEELNMELAERLVEDCSPKIDKASFLKNVILRCEHYGVFIFPDARSFLEKEIESYEWDRDKEQIKKWT